MRRFTPFFTLIFAITLLTSLAGCDDTSSDAPLIRVATSVAPDAGFTTYQHQSGVFALRVPPNWVPNDLPDDSGIRVEFSNLEGDESIVRLTVYVVNTGAPMTREAFLQASTAYLPPTDFANYNWQPLTEPVDMADGSRRVIGVRDYPIIGPRVLNVFMQPNGRYFSVLEADVTDANPGTLDQLLAVVNTYQINTDIAIDQGEIAGGVTSVGNIGFASYYHWADDDGGFNITGLVVNNQNQPVEAVRLTGYLFDTRGNRLGEESIILAQDVLTPEETAPFRLRFEAGRPTSAVRYELHAAARLTGAVARNFYGEENFDVQHDAGYNDTGDLVVVGQLTNRGERLVNNPQVVVAVFDENGNVVATETQFTTKEQLLPTEIDGFEIVVYDIGGTPLRYELSVFGTAE
jgi:hypothetical protein